MSNKNLVSFKRWDGVKDEMSKWNQSYLSGINHLLMKKHTVGFVAKTINQTS